MLYNVTGAGGVGGGGRAIRVVDVVGCHYLCLAELICGRLGTLSAILTQTGGDGVATEARTRELLGE